jgi:hypothetical protein
MNHIEVVKPTGRNDIKIEIENGRLFVYLNAWVLLNGAFESVASCTIVKPSVLTPKGECDGISYSSFGALSTESVNVVADALKCMVEVCEDHKRKHLTGYNPTCYNLGVG